MKIQQSSDNNKDSLEPPKEYGMNDIDIMFSIILSIIQLAIGCASPDNSGNSEESYPRGESVSFIKDTLYKQNSENDSTGKIVTITVSYAAIQCGCAQWFQSKFKNVEFLEGVERFYLEPVSKDIINASDLWDGEHLPLVIKITGRFTKEKELPITYHTKGAPEKARIFWYDKITVVSPSSDKVVDK